MIRKIEKSYDPENGKLYDPKKNGKLYDFTN